MQSEKESTILIFGSFLKPEKVMCWFCVGENKMLR